jgi:hypothetical protein
MRLPWWGVLCGIVGGLVVMFLFDHFGKVALARPTLYSAAVVVAAVMMQWQLRRQIWFWVTMTAIAGLHIPLILFVPWTTNWVPAFVIVPFAAADLYAILTVLSRVGKYVARSESSQR